MSKVLSRRWLKINDLPRNPSCTIVMVGFKQGFYDKGVSDVPKVHYIADVILVSLIRSMWRHNGTLQNLNDFRGTKLECR